MHDLEDLSNRLLRIVSGRMGTAAQTGLTHDTVLIARNLGPAELLLHYGTEEQKQQENSAHQCGNLDGAFEIVGTPDSGPVLLVDDVVDSGWTMTVLATLLRQAGSGPVLPFAMASSRPRDATA